MQFDYESIRDRIVDDLRASASWASILPYSVNRRVIDSVSSGIADLAAYDEYLTRESKWDIAQNKSSLVLESKFRGYDVSRKIGASGNLRVSASSTFNNTPSKIIVIPKYSQFSNGVDISFATTGTNNILTTDNYIDIAVVQGVPTEETFVAAGTNYETIEIDDENIEDSVYEVYVNGVLWVEIEDLNEAASTDKVYTLKNKPNLNGIEIQFGNDIFGKKPIIGDPIVFKYIDTLGINGNVASTGVIDTVISTIYDIDTDPVTIYCTNTDRLDGGTDEETIDNIRANGTDTFQAGEKIVSKTDYEVFLKANSYVLNAVAWGAYEYNIINGNDPWTFLSSQENVVNLSCYTPAGEQLTSAQKLELSALLNPDKPPEDIATFVDVDFIYMAFHVNAFVESEAYILSDVKANIISALQTEFDLSTRDFYQFIYDTKWKKIVSDIAGVAYHNSYIELIEYDTFDSAYAAAIVLPIIDIVEESVKIYVSPNGTSGPYELIGTDDGLGLFTAESGYNLTGSTIAYDTGALNLTVVSGLSEPYGDFSIKVYYQTIDANGDDNLVLRAVNQIFKIEEITDIQASYQTILGE